MSIKFACTCGKAYKVPEKFSGKRVKCKECGEPIRVPSQSQAGVVSTRAAAVSKRSVLESQRIDKAGGSSRRSSSSSGRSSKSGRSSSRSGVPSAAVSGKVTKASPGSDTQQIEPVDLVEGNLLKQYQKKKQEEFKKGEGRLTYFEEGKPKKAFRITRKGATVGRAEGCGVSVPAASVSREHMKVEYKLGTFIISDQQSTNGILVNGRTVRRSSVRDGDIIQLGEAIFRLDC